MDFERLSDFEAQGGEAAAAPSFRICSKVHSPAVRSQGAIELGFKRVGGVTRVATAFQGGCLKLRIPRTPPGEAPAAVLLNTSGGLAEGDRLSQNIRWGAETTASVTTQAAEKVYRAQDKGAIIATRLEVEDGAEAEWLPQETILFDRARLDRDIQVDLSGEARFLGLEAVVLGRAAMGETMREGRLRDRWRIRQDGRLIHADALRLDGPIAELMERAAIGAGARAMAVLILVSGQAAGLLGDLREALAGARGTAAASAWDHMLVVRLLAPDGAVLRHDLLSALAALRDGRAMPRVWSC